MDQDQSRTIMLTTHYMVEADELCDRVAIINRGKVLACDTPNALKQKLQKNAIFEIEVNAQKEVNAEVFKKLAGVNSVTIEENTGTQLLQFILSEEAVLADVIAELTRQELRIQNLQKRMPTLEDVFVKLVGRRMEEEEEHAVNPAS